jgi:TetR/AcrR family transcriptional regulator, transcriptional repressor of aconitase
VTAQRADAVVREHDPLREQLLDAAARVFARQGYDGTRILDIVREAGTSTGAVYGRFRSKNELLREAVVSRSVAPAHLDGGDRVADMLVRGATVRRTRLSDAEAMRLEALVVARREPDVAQALADSEADLRMRIAPLVQAAIDDGTIAPDLDPEAVFFFVRIVSMGLMLHRGSGLPGPPVEGWDALIARIVASFGRSVDPASSTSPSTSKGAS